MGQLVVINFGLQAAKPFVFASKIASFMSQPQNVCATVSANCITSRWFLASMFIFIVSVAMADLGSAVSFIPMSIP